MALITKADIKTELQMADSVTTYDALLTQIANAVQGAFEYLAGRSLEKAALTEYHSPDKYDRMVFLKQFPVDTGETFKVWEDSSWDYDSDTLLSESDGDYQIHVTKGIIYFNFDLGGGLDSIKVQYTAGYTAATLPAVIKQVLVRQGAWWFEQSKNKEWAVTGKGIPSGGSVSYFRQEVGFLADFIKLADKVKMRSIV